jgi:hypothetical protein
MSNRSIHISFSNSEDIREAITMADRYKIDIIDIISPFCLELRRDKYKGSRIGITSLVFGIVALFFVFYFQWWASSQDYLLNIGGRAFFSWPLSVPIAYELTILFAAIGTFIAFLFFTKLPKWQEHDNILYDMTDEFCIIIKDDDKAKDFISKIQFNEVKYIE